MGTRDNEACSFCGKKHDASRMCPSIEERKGQVIGAKYRIERLVGRGGMGAVFEASHLEIGKRFAVKFLLPKWAEDAGVLQRFKQEAITAGRVDAPNIAAVFDFGRAEDGAPYIVMELLQGEDCSSLLLREGRLPVERAVSIVTQACRGLAAVHELGIVHRDLKPGNLFLAKSSDEGDLVKILDFGVAKLSRPEGSDLGLTKADSAVGTAHYMSPEQARGSRSVDARTDIYSLGVILYELLSGRKPYTAGSYEELLFAIFNGDAAPLVELRQELPATLIDVVSRAMAKSADDRFPTASALAQALAPLTGAVFMSVRVPEAPGSDLSETIDTPHSRPTREVATPAALSASAAPPATAPTMSTNANAQPTRARSRAGWLALSAGAVAVAGIAARVTIGSRAVPNATVSTWPGAASVTNRPAPFESASPASASPGPSLSPTISASARPGYEPLAAPTAFSAAPTPRGVTRAPPRPVATPSNLPGALSVDKNNPY